MPTLTNAPAWAKDQYLFSQAKVRYSIKAVMVPITIDIVLPFFPQSAARESQKT